MTPPACLSVNPRSVDIDIPILVHRGSDSADKSADRGVGAHILRLRHALGGLRDATMSETGDLRTLIVSWHWPPANRASAGVLGALFSSAPCGAFRVITRALDDCDDVRCRLAASDLDQRVPPTRVLAAPDNKSRWGLANHWNALKTIRDMVRAGRAVGRDWQASQVLAVYPHRCGMLAGWWVARRLGVPLVLYMHDLCAEALTIRNPLRRWFWSLFDRLCLKSAALVIVPTNEFAVHYQRRRVARTWVLPHCTARPTQPPEPRVPRDDLHLLYSGLVYEPHESAARAFIEATRALPDVTVTLHSNPEGCGGLLGESGARWLPFGEATAALADADVLVILLGIDAPCPEEVMGCFPSKLIDYLTVAKPILAVVPEGCFVDRFITRNGCGVVARTHDSHSIRESISRLRDPVVRSRMARAATRVARDFGSTRWMPRLIRQLRTVSTIPTKARSQSHLDNADTLLAQHLPGVIRS